MTLAIEAVGAVSDVVSQASTRTPEMGQLADKFNRLMEHDPQGAAACDRPTHNDHVSVASEVLGKEDKMLKQTLQAIQDFGVQAPHLSIQEMAAKHIELVYQMTSASMQFNSGAHVAQSLKSGLSTLMKNQ
jgi:type III secretion system HrpB2-like protein